MPTQLSKFRRKPWELESRTSLRVGFVPMIDCAPLLVADALGLFAKYGVKVELRRQSGWGTIREKMLHNELDAAHAHASMVYAINCGIGMVARNCLTGVVLSLGGSAITLTNDLWDLGARDAASLGALIRGGRLSRKLVFASVGELASQAFVLRRWLERAQIDPDRDVRLVVLPSPLVPENLASGYIDGFCVGEPWSSLLLVEKRAACVALPATSARTIPRKCCSS